MKCFLWDSCLAMAAHAVVKAEGGIQSLKEWRMEKKKKRHLVRGECPQCACGDVSFVPSDAMKEKYIGSEEEIEILCPSCGTKHKGKLVVEEE